jgi:hypothetical protein
MLNEREYFEAPGFAFLVFHNCDAATRGGLQMMQNSEWLMASDNVQFTGPDSSVGGTVDATASAGCEVRVAVGQPVLLDVRGGRAERGDGQPVVALEVRDLASAAISLISDDIAVRA